MTGAVLSFFATVSAILEKVRKRSMYEKTIMICFDLDGQAYLRDSCIGKPGLSNRVGLTQVMNAIFLRLDDA